MAYETSYARKVDLWDKLKKSDALVGRVNLPHIGNEKCIKIVLQRNLLK
jgi:hypothetical protein